MESEIKNKQEPVGILPAEIVEMLEDVRMTSINLAVASAKFKVFTDHQEQIKKDLTEVVALALESVQFLSKFLEKMGFEASTAHKYGPDLDQEKLDRNLDKLKDYIERITDSFLRDRELK